MGLETLVFTGCRRKEAPPAPPPHAPESYLKDDAFMGQLSDGRKAQAKLERARTAIAEKMKAKIEAMKEKLKTTDLARVKAELEKDPEWAELYVQCTNANAKCAANRKALLKTVSDRITPPNPNAVKSISK